MVLGDPDKPVQPLIKKTLGYTVEYICQIAILIGEFRESQAGWLTTIADQKEGGDKDDSVVQWQS